MYIFPSFLEKFSGPLLRSFCVMSLASCVAASVAAAPFKETQRIPDDVNGVDNIQCTDDSVTSPDLRFVYSISFCDKAINIFSRDIESGTLNLMDSILFDEETGEGLSPEDEIIMSPDGQNIYVAGRTGLPSDSENPLRRTIFVFDRNMDSGFLTKQQDYDASELDFPIEAKISGDGQYIYIGGRNIEALTVLKRASNGFLSEVQYLTEVTNDIDFSGVAAMEFSPSQDHLYVGLNGNFAGAISTFSRNNATGKLTYIGEVSSEDAETATMERVDSLAVASNGDYLYAVNDRVNDRVEETAIWQFNVEEDASLAFQGKTFVPEEHPDSRFFCLSGLNISSNDALLYIADTCSDNFQLWGIGSEEGALTFLGAEENDLVAQTENVEITPDERFTNISSIGGMVIFDISADTDVTITSPTTVNPSDQFSAEIDIINLGGATAHSVNVRVNTASSLQILDALPSSNSTECSTDEEGFICAVGTVPNGAAEEIILTLRAPAEAGDVDLTASLTQSEVDPDASNSSRSVLIGVGSAAADNSDESEEGDMVDDSSDGGGGGGTTGPIFLLLLTTLLFARGQLLVER